MKWIPDPHGAFPKRLYFDTLRELDDECERLVTYTYFRRFKSDVPVPITDDSLTIMIEQVAELDLYADLRPGVEAVTEFRPNERPMIRISASIANDESRRNRLRTCLAHEWFHAVFHRPLWDLAWAKARVSGKALVVGECHSDAMITAKESNWIEFQAAYASCAILMPRSAVASMVGATGGRAPDELAAGVAQKFEVSVDAARWRLRQLGFWPTAGVGGLG